MIVYITSEIVILAYILDAEESNADILGGRSEMTLSLGRQKAKQQYLILGGEVCLSNVS